MTAKTKRFSTLIETQLPSFITNEYDKFSKFIEKYYEQLESSGQPLDIINNITSYADINYYENNLLNEYTVLTQNLFANDTTIFVEDASSFPKENGYIGINDEICFYKKRTNTEFLEVSRGVSGNIKLGDLYESSEFVSSNSSNHIAGANVANISNLFLYAFVKNFESQYLAAFPEKYLKKAIDKRTLIKNIKNFYKAKGTESSIQFVFNATVPENNGNIPTRYNPSDYTLKSSTSDWITKYSLKVSVLSGDVNSLIGERIIQRFPKYVSAVVDNVIFIGNIEGEDIYELVLAPETISSTFDVISKTKLVKPLSFDAKTGDKIDVISTFGWDNKGQLLIGDEKITFNSKNVNQFDIESRSKSSSYPSGTNVYEYNTIESGDVSFVVLGILYNLNVKSGKPYSLSNDIVEISNPGFTTSDLKIYDSSNNQVRWKLNPSRNSPIIFNNPTIQNKVSNLVSDISAIYEDDQYYYICSSGYPSYSILNSSVVDNIGDQKNLKLIRKNPITVTEVYPTSKRDVGIFVDGTLAVSYKDFDSVSYGKITNIDVTNRGFGYKVAPYVLVNNVKDKAEAVMIGEVVESIKVNTNDIYEVAPTIVITSGRNAKVSAIVTKGRVTSLVIENPGEYYSSPPTITISDKAGKGKFAEYKAIISFDGKIIDFEKIDEGKFYTQENINVDIVPQGRNATAVSKIYQWVKNRFKKLESSLDDNNGFVFPNYDDTKLPGYGIVANPLKLRASISDNLTSSFIEPVTKKHSPILGFAYDGNPIYGSFGFSDPMNINSSIARLSSGYSLNNSRENGPSVVNYPLGTFIDDYTWNPSINKTVLDKNNGRFCVTPEYPEGTYAYFITTNSNNIPVFPYILGQNYYSLPVDSNYNSNISQDDLPKNVKRLYTSDLENNGEGVVAYINDVTTGFVDDIDVVSSPKSFSVGSKLVFNNTGTGGKGASAFVSLISGENVSKINSKNTIVKIDIIENGYFFDGDIIVQENTNARGIVVGNLFNENYVILEDVNGSFDNSNLISSVDSNDNSIQVLNLILNQNSSYTKDFEIRLTDGLNNQDSVIASGIILESSSNQNSVKIKVLQGEFLIDENYQLQSSNLNDTPGSTILALSSLSQNLSPFMVNKNLALALTDAPHNLAVGDKVNIDINPDDNTTETLYYVRKRKYQYINLPDINYSAKLINDGIARIENLNSGIDYISGSFNNVELVFLDQSKVRNNVGIIGNENNAIANVIVTDGKISSVEITNKGRNYKRGDILTILDTRLYQEVGTLKAALLVDHVGISASETVLHLSSLNQLSNGDKIKIGEEIVEISSIDLSQNQVTCIRGVDNSIAVDHFTNQDVFGYKIVYNFDQNYRLLGQTSRDPFVYSFNKDTNNLIINYSYGVNDVIPVLNSNVFYDNSTPRKLVSIKNVSEVQDKLEYSKNNELSFEINPIIEVQKFYSYKFNTSHFSMTNTFLDFSPSLNKNIISEEKEISNESPGSSGSFVKIKFGFGSLIATNTFENKQDLKFDNYYYFITEDNVNTDNSYLKIISDPLQGQKEIIYSTQDKFVYSIDKEPQYQGSGVIKYTTTSRFATGKIDSIFIDNSGTSYNVVPTITGVYVSKAQEATVKPIYDTITKSIKSVEIINRGENYVSPVVIVSNYSNDNSKFRVYSENGFIKRVDVLKSDNNYTYAPELKVIEGGVSLYVKSNTIGVPKNVKFIDNGSSFYNDNSTLSSFTSPYILILKDFGSNSFYDGEEVVQESIINNNKVEIFKATVCFNGWRVGSNILRLKNITGVIDKNLPIKGKSRNSIANISEVFYTEFSPDVKSYYDNQGYYNSDRGKLSNNTQKITDSNFYQDYSYVIKSKTSIDIWRDLITQTIHPAGFKLFGEMLIEAKGSASIPTKQPKSTQVKTINLSTKIIEIANIKKTVTETIINVENLNIERGVGCVSIDANNNSETIATKLKIISNFDGAYDFRTGSIVGKRIFTLIDAKTNLPVNLSSDEEVIIALDGAIQQPGKSYKISGTEIIFDTPPLGPRIEEGQEIPQQVFIGTSFKFKNNDLNNRYLRKIKNIFQLISPPDFFDGKTKEFDLYYDDGNIVKTDENENLIVSLNGVVQIPYTQGRKKNSYYIKRSLDLNITDKIVFSEAPKWDQNDNALLQDATAVDKFFAYSVGNYEIYTIKNELIPYSPQGPFQIISSETKKVKIIQDSRYVLVFIDGILQKPETSYRIVSSSIYFNSKLNYYISKSGEKIYPNVNIFVLYGRDLDKIATFYDFEPDIYFKEIILQANGSEQFETFAKIFNNNKYKVDVVAYQNNNGTINILGKVKGYRLLDESANSWQVVILGHNPVHSEELPSFFLSANYNFDNFVEITSQTTIIYDENVESLGILKRDLSVGLYDTEAGNKAWRVRARNYANLLEGDVIQIDGEKSYRNIIDISDQAKTKQFNPGEYVSNSLYTTIKVSNYNDITFGEGLSVFANIDSNGSVSKLNWNRRDLNLYFKHNFLMQPYSYQYLTPPVLQFIPVDGNGGGAKAEVISIGGQIIDIVLLDGGYGYTQPPKIVVSRGYNKIKKSGRKIDSLSVIKISPDVIDSYSTLSIISEIIVTANLPKLDAINSIVNRLNISREIKNTLKLYTEVNTISASRKIQLIINPDFNVNSIRNISNTIQNTIETRSDVISVCTIDNINKEIISSIQSTATDAITTNALASVNDRGAFLDIPLSETDDIVYVRNTSGFPDTGKLLIGKEIIFYSKKYNDRFINVMRGQFGSTVTSHEAGDYLRLIPDTISVVDTSVIKIRSELNVSIVSSFSYSSRFRRIPSQEPSVSSTDTKRNEYRLRLQINNGFSDQPGDLANYKTYTLGNTIGTYDTFKFDDNGVANINEVTIGLIDLYYPFMTIGDFTDRKDSEYANSNDEFNWTYFTINEYGSYVSSDVLPDDTSISVTNTGGFPNEGYLYIGNEIVYYEGKNATTFLNVQRGIRNTIPQTHVTNTYIRSLI